MFKASDWSVPESDLIGHLKRNEIREMKQLEKLSELVRSLPIGPRLAIGLSIEDGEVICNIPPGSNANDTEHRIREQPLVHHEVDDFNFLSLVGEECDGVSMLIVRQEQPPRCPDELRYAQLVAGLDVPRLHEGLLREQALHTSVG